MAKSKKRASYKPPALNPLLQLQIEDNKKLAEELLVEQAAHGLTRQELEVATRQVKELLNEKGLLAQDLRDEQTQVKAERSVRDIMAGELRDFQQRAAEHVLQLDESNKKWIAAEDELKLAQEQLAETLRDLDIMHKRVHEATTRHLRAEEEIADAKSQIRACGDQIALLRGIIVAGLQRIPDKITA